MIHFKNKKLWVMLFFLVSIAYGMDNNNNLDQNFLELDDIDIYKLEMSKRELVAKYNEKIEGKKSLLPEFPEYKPLGEEQIPCFYQGGLVFGKFEYVFLH
jgi:hypothetical protein